MGTTLETLMAKKAISAKTSKPLGREVRGYFKIKYFFMSNFLQRKENVSLCYNKTCIEASGQNARLLTFAFCTMLVLVGVAALTRSN